MVFVWWAALVKSLSAVFTFIFGPDYRQAMYGKSMKKNSFILDDSITVTNHGSYGTIPKKVLEARWQFQVIQLSSVFSFSFVIVKPQNIFILGEISVQTSPHFLLLKK